MKHVVNLEGWLELGRFLKALGGESVPAGLGRSAQPAAGEAPSTPSGTSGGFSSSWISPLFPPPLPGRWEQMCPAVEMLRSLESL